MIVLGIDPGLNGGIALVEQEGDRRRVLLAVDIPTTGEDAKRRVDVSKVLRVLQPHRIAAGFIERAQAMPARDKGGKKIGGQGASSGFIYGRAVGALEACILGMQIPMTVIESSAWKKTHGLIKPKDADGEVWSKVVKENSRQRALVLFPAAAEMIARKLDHGRAEAILIADHGLTSLQPQKITSQPRSRRRADRQPDLLDV